MTERHKTIADRETVAAGKKLQQKQIAVRKSN